MIDYFKKIIESKEMSENISSIIMLFIALITVVASIVC